MNREYKLNTFQRNKLDLFNLSTKYSVKDLVEATWIMRSSQNYDPFGKIWLDSIDYEDCEFEIISHNDDYKLIIYTNEG